MLHKKNRKNKSPIVQYAESPGGGGRVRRPSYYRGRRAGWAQAWHTLTNNINNIFIKMIIENKNKIKSQISALTSNPSSLLHCLLDEQSLGHTNEIRVAFSLPLSQCGLLFIGQQIDIFAQHNFLSPLAICFSLSLYLYYIT